MTDLWKLALAKDLPHIALPIGEAVEIVTRFITDGISFYHVVEDDVLIHFYIKEADYDLAQHIASSWSKYVSTMSNS
jgi:hypothetical protein